jgi:hypothetical protein
MSLPRGVTPEAAAPATTTNSATMTHPTMCPRLGPLTRATEKLWPRAAERPRRDDTIFLPEGRLEGRPLPGSFLCRSSRPPMPQRSMPVPRCPRRYLPGLAIRRGTAHKPSQCDVHPRQPEVCRSTGRAANLAAPVSGRHEQRGAVGRISRRSPLGDIRTRRKVWAELCPWSAARTGPPDPVRKAGRGVLPKCEPIGTTRASWSFELPGGPGRIAIALVWR